MKNPHFAAHIDVSADWHQVCYHVTAIVGNGPPYIECYQEDT